MNAFQLTEIAQLFRIPIHMIADQPNSTINQYTDFIQRYAQAKLAQKIAAELDKVIEQEIYGDPNQPIPAGFIGQTDGSPLGCPATDPCLLAPARPVIATCPHCSGRGKRIGHKGSYGTLRHRCEQCNGNGWTTIIPAMTTEHRD